MSFELSAAAEQDVRNILRYTIREFGADQMYKYQAELNAVLTMLAENPGLGRARPDIRENILQFPAKNHVIFYSSEKGKIIIRRILGNRQNPAIHF